MSVAAPGVRVHPVLECVATLAAALGDGLDDVPVELLSTSEKAAVLLELSRIGDQVAALGLRVLAAADDLAVDGGARDAGAWLAQHTRTDAGPRRRDLRVASALADRWSGAAAALADGRVNRAQAEVIVDALDALPLADLPADVAPRAEAHLVDLAADFTPRQLRVLGRRILDVVAPEVGEAHEARALAAEERRADETAALTFHPAGNGCTRINLLVPDAAAHRLRTYLEAFTSPRHDAMTGGEANRVPAHRQRGRAFCAFLEAVDPQRLPLHGGDATTVVVTVTLDALRAELAVAGLVSADDDRITAAQARRLACTAKVVPVVLGSDSEILDLGRAARLYSAAQRKALRIRDRRCRAEGCAVPAPWCEAHHRRPWSRGGSTDLDDGVLLCNFHHHRAHDERYLHTDLPNGDVRFSRRT